MDDLEAAGVRRAPVGLRTAIDIDVSAPLPRANLVVDLYDLDANGTGPLVSRQGHLLRQSGKHTLVLWSADWKFRKGHRIALRVADANTDWWVHAPTKQSITIHGGTAQLPFLTMKRTETIQGDPGAQLDSYLAERVTVPASTLQSAQSAGFALPPRMTP